MKVVVSGGASGIGLGVVELCASHYEEVLVIDPKPLGLRLEGVRSIESKIQDVDIQNELSSFTGGGQFYYVHNAHCSTESTIKVFSQFDMEKDTRPKSIVIVSSICGHQGTYGEDPMYVAEKAALLALTKYYANRFAPHCRVNSVSPGPIITDFTKEWQGLKCKAAVAKENLLNRWGTTPEVASTTMAMLTQSFVTGQDLVVDGGEVVKSHYVEAFDE